MKVPRYFSLIPAAGVGERVGAECPKQYLSISGKPMLTHVLDTFIACEVITHTFVVVSADDGYIHSALPTSDKLAQRMTILYHGGETRQQSVLNGLRSMADHVDDSDWVLVHDAARPGLTIKLIEHLIAAVKDDEVGGLLAMPIADTLKRSDANGRVQTTVSRNGLWAAQTPQMFRYGLLHRALLDCGDVTDEASAIEALGLRPKLIEGSHRNFKVTLPHDVALAELYLKEQG